MKSNVLICVCFLISTPLFAGTVYTNGPVNGNNQGLNIRGEFAVSDSFTVLDWAAISGFDFGVWTFFGDTATGVDWSIGSSSFGSDFGKGTASVTSTFVLNNGPFDVALATVSGLDVPMAPGTYWLTLTNGQTTQSGSIYWDVNSGSSLAVQTTIGPRSSESFDVLGTQIPAFVPEPATLSFLTGGLLVFAGALRRRR